MGAGGGLKAGDLLLSWEAEWLLVVGWLVAWGDPRQEPFLGEGCWGCGYFGGFVAVLGDRVVGGG